MGDWEDGLHLDHLPELLAEGDVDEETQTHVAEAEEDADRIPGAHGRLVDDVGSHDDGVDEDGDRGQLGHQLKARRDQGYPGDTALLGREVGGGLVPAEDEAPHDGNGHEDEQSHGDEDGQQQVGHRDYPLENLGGLVWKMSALSRDQAGDQSTLPNYREARINNCTKQTFGGGDVDNNTATSVLGNGGCPVEGVVDG